MPLWSPLEPEPLQGTPGQEHRASVEERRFFVCRVCRVAWGVGLHCFKWPRSQDLGRTARSFGLGVPCEVFSGQGY